MRFDAGAWAPAASPARQRATDQQEGFSGGLNLSADDSELQANELRRADETRLTQYGAAQKRLGSQYLHSAALGSGNPIRGGFSWARAASTTELVICNGKLYTGVYGAGPPVTFTDRGGTLSTTAVPSFAAFKQAGNETAYIADGGLLNKWDGATLTENIASTPNLTWVAAYNNRLLGGTGDSETVYWSALGNGDTCGVVASGGGSAIVQAFGAQKIVVGYALGASLLLYHVAAISRFTGYTLDDISITSGTQGVSNDVGTIAPRSIVALETMHLFLSDRGVYAATEGGVQPVSSPIETTLAGLDATQWARVATAHNRRYREVLFYLPDVGIYVYNYRIQQWSGPWAGGYISPVTHAMWGSRDSTGRTIWLAGTAGGFVKRGDMPSTYKDNVASDGTGGTAFPYAVRCHRFYHGDNAAEKSYRWAYVLADLGGSASAVLSWTSQLGAGSYSLSGAAALWDGSTWDGTIWDAGAQTMRVPIFGRGPYIDFTLSDAGSTGQPSVSAISAEAFILGRRGS